MIQAREFDMLRICRASATQIAAQPVNETQLRIKSRATPPHTRTGINAFITVTRGFCGACWPQNLFGQRSVNQRQLWRSQRNQQEFRAYAFYN